LAQNHAAGGSMTTSAQNAQISLTDAVKTACHEQIKALIEQNTNIELRDSDGNTTLLIAASKGFTRIARLLLVAGADKTACNNDGENALVLAAREANPRLVRLLLQDRAMCDGKECNHNVSLALLSLCGSTILTSQHLNSDSDPTWEPWDRIKAPTVLRVKRTKRLLSRIAEMLIESGANTDTCDSSGNTPLHSFIWHEMDECAQLLIDRKQHLNAVNTFGVTPLYEAVSKDNTDVAMQLLDAGADPNTGDGYFPIHYLGYPQSSIELLKRIITVDANINKSDKHGKTALHYACSKWCNNSERIEILLNAGADATIQDSWGYAPSDYAMMAYVNRVADSEQAGKNITEDIAEYLLPFNHDYARFIIAAMNGELEQLKTELALGIPQKVRVLALDRAVGNGRYECCKELLEHGTNPNSRSTHGSVPLIGAAQMLVVDIAELLLTYGADVEAADDFGQRPLYMVCQAGISPFENIAEAKSKRYQLAKMLLNKGADVNAVCNEGFTPLRQAALAAGDAELVRLLLQRGACHDIADNSGSTVIEYAEEYGFTAIVEILNEHFINHMNEHMTGKNVC
jgi:ankyrin repeat protein